MSCTEDDACKLVSSVYEGGGFEAYQLIKKRYEPTTPGTKRAILKASINNPPCKKVSEVESNLLHIEELFKTYEAMTTDAQQLPGELNATIMMEPCNRELREYFDLITETTSVTGVRSAITNHIERTIHDINNGVHAMEVGNMDDEVNTCLLYTSPSPRD